MKRILKWTVITCCIAVIGWQALQHKHNLNEYRRQLSYVPEEMHVSSTIFANEQSWGFGPGGNETGLIVYNLPEDIAEKVNTEGITYLSSFPSAHLGYPHSWEGKYEKWHATPISETQTKWFEVPASDKKTLEPKLSNYLDQYGFGISIPSEIEAEFNKTITSTGNFYAYGRIGMILVAPAIHKIFYVYAG